MLLPIPARNDAIGDNLCVVDFLLPVKHEDCSLDLAFLVELNRAKRAV